MKKVLVVYQSKTGFAEQYAQWIAQALDCKAVSYKEWKKMPPDDADIVIYGGGVYAGQIRGLRAFRETMPRRSGKQCVYFATGVAPSDSEKVRALAVSSFSELDRNDAPFFYFLGGLNYENMGFFDRSLMKLVSRAMTKEREMQGPETRIPDATRSFDYSSEQFVQPLVDKVRSLSAR